MSQRPTVADRGTPFYLRITDEVTGAPQDPTLATVTATVRLPDQTEIEIALAASSNPAYPAADGWVYYLPEDVPGGASWFSLGGPGLWRFFPRYQLDPQESWRSAIAATLRVYP